MEHPSLAKRLFIYWYGLVMIINELTINNVSWSVIQTLFVVLFLIKTSGYYNKLNMRMQAIVVTSIGMISVVASLVIHGADITVDLFKNQVVPQMMIIIFLSLRLSAMTQVIALILDPYLTKPKLKILKATESEFRFAQTMVLLFCLPCAVLYYFGEADYLNIGIKALLTYIIIKALTIAQTKLLEESKA
jgi:hypothetical protein